jgi:prepilin peptidase CpaA
MLDHPASLLALAFPALAVAAGLCDLAWYRIPNALSIGLAAGFVLHALAAKIGWTAFFLHAGAGAAFLLVGFALFAKGWIGGGDAKLLTGAALWVGWEGLPQFLTVMGLAGGVLALWVLAASRLPGLRRRWNRPAGVPYGAAIAVAALWHHAAS